MTDMLDTFKRFMDDPDAANMYVVGRAGTGKTTKLKGVIEHCVELDINSVTCAYTHKAVGILAQKIPFTADNVICTLHSYLKKRPSINAEAVKVAQIEGNSQTGLPARVDVMFLDEFSMVGSKDHESIKKLQYDEDGKLVTKVVWIGDENQLEPVKDEFTIVPSGDYMCLLTHVYRQAGDNPLLDTLTDLNNYISGISVCKLTPHSNLIRGVSIVGNYRTCKTTKCLLAYTNARVEALNAEVEGKYAPDVGDTLFSPTTRQLLTLQNIEAEPFHITNIKGDIVDVLDKYKTLKTISNIEEVDFYSVATDEGEEHIRAVVFGHDTYLKKNSELAKKAVKANRDIERKFSAKASQWAKANWQEPLARTRSTAWKNYLAFKSNVICIDFNHAMTIHKSQGSTYENVFIDTDDVAKCADQDFKLYLKLMYVAISRASDTVYTN